jgi:hypothetical protein
MFRVLLNFILLSFSDLLVTIPRCYTGLTMCSIYLDKSTTRVNRCTAITSSRTFSAKADPVRLLKRRPLLLLCDASQTINIFIVLRRHPSRILVTCFRIFLALRLRSMEDQKNLKRLRSPSDEGFSSLSKASTPPPSRSGSPPPTQSPPATSSRRLCLPPCEQGGPSEPVPVVDLALSSDEEDFIADTSHDEELARKLFGDLNRDILGPPGDGKIIVLNDSEDEKPEDVAVNAEAAPFSAANSTDFPTSAPYADEAPDGVSDDNADGGDEAGSP